MRFIPAEIPDVLLIEPEIFADKRGAFFENYRKDVFFQNGIREEFVQDNHSVSAKGVLRGLHYQAEPRAQAKLVRVARGEAYDVAVDIRKGSKTFGRYVAANLSAENKRMLYIPKGFAHGFLALEHGTELLYKVSDFYSPAHDRGIFWNDPSIGIDWPKTGVDPILSDKDGNLPALKASAG